MTNVDRRAILRYVGFGCALTPIIAASASPWRDAAQAADPELDVFVQEVVGHALRIKNELSSGGSGLMPGDLHVAAGHLRLLDSMIQTRGLKRRLRDAQFSDVAALDRAAGSISVALADNLTAAGFPTRHDEPEQVYLRHRDRFSEHDRVQLHQLLRNGSFLAVQARGLDHLANRLRNRDVDISPANLIGRPGRDRATGRIQLAAQTVPGPGPYDVVSFCEGLQNMALMLSFTAFLMAFIPPLAIIALIEQILSLILEFIALFIC